MNIEKITRDTAAAASYIYAMSWKIGYKGIIPQPYLDKIPLGQWADWLGNDNHTHFQADYLLSDNGDFIATASICEARNEQYRGWGEIMSIYVLPEQFRKGYGTTLFSYLTDQLQKSGYSKIYLWVLEDNQRARGFYESMGLQTNGDRIVQNIGGKDLAEIRYVNQI